MSALRAGQLRLALNSLVRRSEPSMKVLFSPTVKLLSAFWLFCLALSAVRPYIEPIALRVAQIVLFVLKHIVPIFNEVIVGFILTVGSSAWSAVFRIANMSGYISHIIAILCFIEGFDDILGRMRGSNLVTSLSLLGSSLGRAVFVFVVYKSTLILAGWVLFLVHLLIVLTCVLVLVRVFDFFSIFHFVNIRREVGGAVYLELLGITIPPVRTIISVYFMVGYLIALCILPHAIFSLVDGLLLRAIAFAAHVASDGIPADDSALVTTIRCIRFPVRFWMYTCEPIGNLLIRNCDTRYTLTVAKESEKVQVSRSILHIY